MNLDLVLTIRRYYFLKYLHLNLFILKQILVIKKDLNNHYYTLNKNKDRTLQGYDSYIYSISNKINTSIHWMEFIEKGSKIPVLGSHPMHYMEYSPNLLSFFPFNKKFMD